MNFKGRHVISITDFSRDELLHILKTAEYFEKNPRSKVLEGKVMGSLFFEPSTRTKLSFQAAIKHLGGKVLGFSSQGSSSVKKGETVWDTIKMVEKYTDIIVMRNPLEGSARLASEASRVPIINGGDGANQHPTQTLLDLYTIKKEKGNFENLKVGMLGDLKYGRTVHSLTNALMHFKPEFVFIAPDELQMPKSYLEALEEAGIKYSLSSDMDSSINDLDILYVTRIQQERFPDPVEYEKFKGVFQLDKDDLKNAKKDLKVMHPLPRVDEISKDVDDTPFAVYFEQAENGIHVRKALLALLLGEVE